MQRFERLVGGLSHTVEIVVRTRLPVDFDSVLLQLH